MSAKTIIILAATRARAHQVGERMGIPKQGVLWPRARDDLRGKNRLPLYVDMSVEGHTRHEEMADYIAARWRAVEAQQEHDERLGAGPSLALD